MDVLWEPPGTTKKYCVFDEGRKDMYIYIDVVIHDECRFGQEEIQSFQLNTNGSAVDRRYFTLHLPGPSLVWTPTHSGAWREDCAHSYK